MDYKKILEGVVDIINTAEKSDIGFTNICTYIGENCPELKESEDEKMRKEIIYHIKNCDDTIDEETEKRMIAWLEKQGEQKPAWSEEDEKMLNHIIGLLEGLPNLHNWLKSLKGRVQPKNHWKPSKEQMEALAWALSLAKNCGEECAFDLRTLQDQLKKLTEE